MQYCSLQHQTLFPSPVTPTTGCCFCFGSISSFFFFFGVISPHFSSSKLGTYRPGEFIFQCPIFLPFHTVHEVLKARILKWFAIPFSRQRRKGKIHPSECRIARRDKKAFLSYQCKEIEENNRVGKTKNLLKKIIDTKEIFHAKMGTIKDRIGMDITETEDIKKK